MFSTSLILSSLFALCSAHATLNPPVSTGSYSAAAVRVPHGCNKSATLRVMVKIPDGVGSVKPTRVSGWRLFIDQRKLPVPVTTEGGVIDEEVDMVTWGEGNLPDNEYQDFGLTFKLPPADDGKKFYFPVMQDCGNGLWVNWTEIPKDGSKPRYPAPALTVMANGTLVQAAASSAPASKSSAGMASIHMATSIILFVATIVVA